MMLLGFVAAGVLILFTRNQAPTDEPHEVGANGEIIGVSNKSERVADPHHGGS